MSILPYKLDAQTDQPSTAPNSGFVVAEPNLSRFDGLRRTENPGLAQLVAAPALHAGGRGSESLSPDQPHQDRGTHRKEYIRAYQRAWVRERRAAFFNGKQCDQCGSQSRLELHHRNPQEKISHGVWSWSAPRRAAEIAKCVVLCSCCHLRITKLDFATRRTRIAPGKSGIPNVYWRADRRVWMVQFDVMGREVHPGGCFRNFVTARMAAESFRSTLAKSFAEQRVAISCIKQYQLPIEVAQ